MRSSSAQSRRSAGRAFSLLVIAVSFIPIFALEAQEGRLFKPLAFTKNFAMIVAAILAITLDPAMRLFFTHIKEYTFRPVWLRKLANAVVVGKIRSEENHPISKPLMRAYHPALEFVLKYKWATILIAFLIVVVTIPFYFKLGSEFMPPLNEGVILYMPTTLPGISVTEAERLLQVQDRILRSFPEVERVFGKAGRAETSTDPAPFSMMETTVVLKPENEWRKKERWFSGFPEFLQSVLRRFWRDRISWEELKNEMDLRMQLPGVSNAWTMPIRARIDMLTTGVRTPVGVKIFGADLTEIEALGTEVERIVKAVPGTSSAFAERVAGGYFLDFELKRQELARYGLSISDAEMIIMSAIGGEPITTTIEGRERYTVNLRYLRDYRSNLDDLRRVLVPTMDGAQIPLEQIAEIKLVQGPAMIRDENGLLTGYVYIDVAGRDIGGYVGDAKKAVRENLRLPPGYSLAWSGQYEYMTRVRQRLTLVVPLTLFIIFLLLYFNTGSVTKTFIILLALPFSAVGAIWLLYLLGYHISIGVWVGLIALMGVDAETGVFMLLYLDLAYKERKDRGLMKGLSDLKEAISQGAVKRLRPKIMTVGCMFMGLLPIMWSVGTGSDVMKRIATPMIGGIFTSFLMELLVYPCIYLLWKQRELKKLS